MSALTELTEHFKTHPNEIFTNYELAEITEFHISTISTNCTVLFDNGFLTKVGAGVWRYDAPAGSEDGASPSTVKIMDDVIDQEKGWIEVKVRRAVKSPGGYTYFKINDRDGRVGIIVWDE
jgi:hypothetical protein